MEMCLDALSRIKLIRSVRAQDHFCLSFSKKDKPLILKPRPCKLVKKISLN